MIKYIRKNCFPVIWEIAFLASCFLIPASCFIYTNLVFYLGLFIYFYVTKEFSFKAWSKSLRTGWQFWKAVILTGLGFVAAFALTTVLEALFAAVPTGMLGLRRDSWITLMIFAVSTILLPSVCEEAFYRSSLIVIGKSKLILVATTLLSMFLYAVEHATAPFGVLLAMIWAVPLSTAYIRTKNIYVVMTAHFIGNLLGNGFDTAVGFMHLIK